MVFKALFSFTGILVPRRVLAVIGFRNFNTNGYFLSSKTKIDNDQPVSMPNPFEPEKQKCILCKMNIRPDYKNVKLLSQFVSPYTGRTYGRHITGLCKQKQQQLELEILKAQQSGLMPFYFKDPIFLKDPKLFNPERPFRPHDY